VALEKLNNRPVRSCSIMLSLEIKRGWLSSSRLEIMIMITGVLFIDIRLMIDDNRLLLIGMAVFTLMELP
jgi:hypothetical protein